MRFLGPSGGREGPSKNPTPAYTRFTAVSVVLRGCSNTLQSTSARRDCDNSRGRFLEEFLGQLFWKKVASSEWRGKKTKNETKKPEANACRLIGPISRHAPASGFFVFAPSRLCERPFFVFFPRH